VTDASPTTGPGALLLADSRYEPVLRDWIRLHGSLIQAAESTPAAVRLTGRGRVAAVPEPGADGHGRWVVRHYHRGGAVARALGDRYLRVGTPRPFEELRLLEAVRGRGVPAPEPVGAAVYPAGAFYRGDLVTRWIPDSVDLATLLFDTYSLREPIEASAGMRAAGRLVRLLHDRGIEHRDLNLKNILLGAHHGPPVPRPGATGSQSDPRPMILDLDRARLHDGAVPDRAQRAMIERFWRSAGKWERRQGRPLPAGLRSAFEAGYADEA
jgi:3-deoxy-D-manno-octulosonic acid kinase